MTDARLDDLDRLANGATKGPWSVGTSSAHDRDDEIFGAHYVLSEHSPYRTNRNHWGKMKSLHGCSAPFYKPDAAFIAASRTAVPELVAEVRRLRNAMHVVVNAHEAKARLANFSGCGCEDCAPLRAALSPTPSQKEEG